MKKVLLIGDSIRQGYDHYVKAALKDVAEVYYPEENCRFAQYVLRNLHEWKQQLQLSDDVDVVHWNVGLWDTLELYGDGLLTPINVYEQFIGRICKRLKLLFPKATIIFATSTPVMESRFPNPDIALRKNSDVEAYNRVAAKVAEKHGFIINDLYKVVSGCPEEYYSDVVHLYTEKGTELLANAVLKALLKPLGEEIKEWKYEYLEKSDILGI